MWLTTDILPPGSGSATCTLCSSAWVRVRVWACNAGNLGGGRLVMSPRVPIRLLGTLAIRLRAVTPPRRDPSSPPDSGPFSPWDLTRRCGSRSTSRSCLRHPHAAPSNVTTHQHQPQSQQTILTVHNASRSISYGSQSDPRSCPTSSNDPAARGSDRRDRICHHRISILPINTSRQHLSRMLTCRPVPLSSTPPERQGLPNMSLVQAPSCIVAQARRMAHCRLPPWFAPDAIEGSPSPTPEM